MNDSRRLSRPPSRKFSLNATCINVTSVVASVYCERKVVLDQLYGREDTPFNQQAQQAGESAHLAFARNSERLMAEQDEMAMRARDRRCYVASYAFGEDDPITHALRVWRDEVLLHMRLGRIFVRVYYRISPSLIRVARHLPFFKRFTAFVIKKCVDTYLQVSPNKMRGEE
jgi:hypothetical protein